MHCAQLILFIVCYGRNAMDPGLILVLVEIWVKNGSKLGLKMVNLAVKIGGCIIYIVVLDRKLAFKGYERWFFLFVERENGPFFSLKTGFKASLTKNLAQKLGHFWVKVAYFDPNFDFLAKSRF